MPKRNVWNPVLGKEGIPTSILLQFWGKSYKLFSELCSSPKWDSRALESHVGKESARQPNFFLSQAPTTCKICFYLTIPNTELRTELLNISWKFSVVQKQDKKDEHTQHNPWSSAEDPMQEVP